MIGLPRDAHMNVLVIEPGHGSVWLSRAVYVRRDGTPSTRGHFVRGEAWEYDGGWNMPDDYRGYEVSVTYPRRWILKVEEVGR
jgi:hypothetical protein